MRSPTQPVRSEIWTQQNGVVCLTYRKEESLSSSNDEDSTVVNVALEVVDPIDVYNKISKVVQILGALKCGLAGKSDIPEISDDQN